MKITMHTGTYSHIEYIFLTIKQLASVSTYIYDSTSTKSYMAYCTQIHEILKNYDYMEFTDEIDEIGNLRVIQYPRKLYEKSLKYETFIEALWIYEFPGKKELTPFKNYFNYITNILDRYSDIIEAENKKKDDTDLFIKLNNKISELQVENGIYQRYSWFISKKSRILYTS